MGLAPQIAEAFARRGRLPLIDVGGALLDLVEGGRGLGLGVVEEALDELDELLRAHPDAALLAPRGHRVHVRLALEARPGVPVLCHEELMEGLEVEIVGVFGADL